MPSTVIVKADRSFDSKEGLAALEQVSRELAKVDGVKLVRSATRPAGEPLQDLEVSKQADTLSGGIGKSTEGLDKIGKGLSQASSSLADNKPKLRGPRAERESSSAARPSCRKAWSSWARGWNASARGSRTVPPERKS